MLCPPIEFIVFNSIELAVRARTNPNNELSEQNDEDEEQVNGQLPSPVVIDQSRVVRSKGGPRYKSRSLSFFETYMTKGGEMR